MSAPERAGPALPTAASRDGLASRARYETAGRAAWTAAAVAAIAWGLVDHRFRDPEGFWTGAACLPLALAGAALLVAAAPRSWGASRFWIVLALVGQAATLQLIAAGNRVGYQHLRVDPQRGWTWLALGIIAAQLLAVMVALSRAARPSGWLGQRDDGQRPGGAAWPLRMWQWAVLLVVFSLSSATVSRDPRAFVAELLGATLLQGVALANLWLAARALPSETASAWGRRWADWFGCAGQPAVSRGADPLPWLVAGGVVAVCAALSWFVYERHPHVPDEVVYLIHARYFAAGHLTMPPVPEPFHLDLLHYEPDRWYSPVPPGWPAVLALGALISAEWLVNPLLTGLDLLLAYRLAADLYGRGTGRLVALLLAASPWFVFMGMNFMTHQWALACALGAAVLLARVARGGSALWALPSGGCLALLSLIRPLEAMCAVAVLGLWSLTMRRGVAGLASALLVTGAVAVGSAQLAYNAHLTGDARKFPIMAYTDKYYGPGRNDMGFGPSRGLGWSGLDPRPGHDLFDAAINADLNLSAVNTELFGWAIGSLAPVIVVLLLPSRRRADWALAGAAAVVIGAHTFYWFSGGPDFGARYWYLILFPCVALVVRGAIALARAGPDAAWRGRVAWALAMLMLLALANFFPWRAVDKYYHYRGMRPDVRRLASEHDWRRALVLVRGERHPDYASAAIFNPLDLRQTARPVYAWDKDSAARREALAAFPDRAVWIVDGPTVTGNGFQVVAGPLSAADVDAPALSPRRSRP